MVILLKDRKMLPFRQHNAYSAIDLEYFKSDFVEEVLYDLIQARIGGKGVMSMSKGDKMLKEAGYEKYLDNEDTLIYKYERETFRVSLMFDKRPFKKTFHAIEGLWVSNDKGWYVQEFKNEWDKYCSAQGYWLSIWHEFTIQELQAINEKCKELRWKE